MIPQLTVVADLTCREDELTMIPVCSGELPLPYTSRKADWLIKTNVYLKMLHDFGGLQLVNILNLRHVGQHLL